MARSSSTTPFLIAALAVLAALGYGGYGLTKMKIESDVSKLWIPAGSRVDNEQQFLARHIPAGKATDQQFVTVVPARAVAGGGKGYELDPSGNALMVAALTAMEDASKRVVATVVEVGGRTYGYQDVCSAFGTAYAYPCARYSPLDCFKEGAFDCPIDPAKPNGGGGAMAHGVCGHYALARASFKTMTDAQARAALSGTCRLFDGGRAGLPSVQKQYVVGGAKPRAEPSGQCACADGRGGSDCGRKLDGVCHCNPSGALFDMGKCTTGLMAASSMGSGLISANDTATLLQIVGAGGAGAAATDPVARAIVFRAVGIATMSGACTAGGGACASDAECGGAGTHGACAGAAPYESAAALETVWKTIAPEALRQRLASPSADARVQFTSYAGGVGRHDVTLAQAAEILAKWKVAMVANVQRVDDAAFKADSYQETGFGESAHGSAWGLPYPEAGKDTRYLVNSFSSDSFSEILEDSVAVSPWLVAAGYGLLVVYAALVFFRWRGAAAATASRSCAVALCVVLVAAGVAGGMGISAWLGVPFNATSTHVLPFLLLGLGCDDLFVIACNSPTPSDDARRGRPVLRSAGAAARRSLRAVGGSVTLTTLVNVGAFLMGRLTPLPVVVAFSTQAAIGVMSVFAVNVAVVPIVLGLDYRRAARGRLCCYPLCCLRAGAPLDGEGADDDDVETGGITTSDAVQGAAVDANESAVPWGARCGSSATRVSVGEDRRAAAAAKGSAKRGNDVGGDGKGCVAGWLLPRLLLPVLRSRGGLALVLLLFAGLLGAAGYGSARVVKGLGMQDVVPGGRQEHTFVQTRFTEFPMYPIDVTLRAFDYRPRANQKLLLDVATAVTDTPLVRPDFFWYHALVDWARPAAGPYGNAKCGAAHPLTGGRCGAAYGCETRFDGDGPFLAEADFYRCFQTWLNVDATSALATSNAPLVDPWAPAGSRALAFADAAQTTLAVGSIPLTAEGLTGYAKFTELITTVRAALARAAGGTAAAGAFPSGVPFTYWEQYVSLDKHVVTTVGLALGIAFAVAVALIFAFGVRAGHRDNSLARVAGAALWGGLLMAAVVAMIVFELYGFLGLLDIKLSAIPAISIVMAVGVGVEFTAHLVLAFVAAPRNASRGDRVAAALDQMFAATWHGFVSTLLGVLMLAFSGIDFIFRYFFLVYLLVAGLGALNGMLLLPALLAVAGPPGLGRDGDGKGHEEDGGGHGNGEEAGVGGGVVEMTTAMQGAPPAAVEDEDEDGGDSLVATAAAVVAVEGAPKTPAGPPPPLAQV